MFDFFFFYKKNMTFIKKKIKTIYLESQQTQSYKEFHLSKL